MIIYRSSEGADRLAKEKTRKGDTVNERYAFSMTETNMWRRKQMNSRHQKARYAGEDLY